MRVLLVGRPDERERLRAEIDRTAFTIAGEFDTLAEARNADEEVDAFLVGVGRTLRVRQASLKGSPHGEHAFEEPLTPREVQVLELLAEGLPNKAIAGRLGISDQTVKFHVSSISGKLGAKNRTDAVRRAVRRGLITL